MSKPRGGGMKENSLQIASGEIGSLTVNDERRNIVFANDLSDVSKGVGIAAAAAGMAAESAQVSSLGNTEEDTEVYQFEINGAWFRGYTRAVEFKDGDFLEVVYQPSEPTNVALAVRRPSTRNIWVQHFMTKGTNAGFVHACRVWLLVTLTFGTILGIFLFGIILLQDGWGGVLDFFQTEQASICAGIFFGLMLLPIPLFAPKYYKFAKEATEVFRAFGFDRPKWVNLDKTSKPKRMTWNESLEKTKDMHYSKAFRIRQRDEFTCWY